MVAWEALNKYNYDEAVFHTQECVEYPFKALLEALEIQHGPKHVLPEDRFEDALRRLESLLSEK